MLADHQKAMATLKTKNVGHLAQAKALRAKLGK
jgi:hypothetical protein